MQSSAAFLKANLPTAAWSLVAIVNLVAIFIWGDMLSWQFDSLSAYVVFPLLGLVAFSTMWAQYVAGTIRRLVGGSPAVLRRFSDISGAAVTTAILLHPSLIVWQLWRDGFGLPPSSFSNYVAPSLMWALSLGVISFLIFLSFELRHRFGGRSWWKYIDYANDAAIIAIYVHALRLGSHTQTGWFEIVWVFYGIILAASLIHKYWTSFQAK